MHVPGVPLTYRERLPNEALIEVHALGSELPTRPGVSIHSGTQLQNYKDRSDAKAKFRSSHLGRPGASDHSNLLHLVARLAVFHFRIKHLNPTVGCILRRVEAIRISRMDAEGMHEGRGVHRFHLIIAPPARAHSERSFALGQHAFGRPRPQQWQVFLRSGFFRRRFRASFFAAGFAAFSAAPSSPRPSQPFQRLRAPCPDN